MPARRAAAAGAVPDGGPTDMRSKLPLLPTLARLRTLARRLGPYVLIELLLPGGTLVALLLYLCRRAASGAARPSRPRKRQERPSTPLAALAPAPSTP